MAKTTKTRVASFANPGFDANSALDNVGNEDGTVAVNFAPFEEILESCAVSNPVYDDIGMTAMTSAKSNHSKGAIGGQGDGKQELPKKQPFPLEERNKNAEALEEPRYESLWSKGEVADKDQIKIDVQGENTYEPLRGDWQGENTYELLPGDWQGENTYEPLRRGGQTVVSLVKSDDPFAKTK